MSKELIDSIEKEVHAYIESKVEETGESTNMVAIAITRAVCMYQINKSNK